MGESGPPRPTGLQEVLWLQHNPPHWSYRWAVFMIDRHTNKRRGAFTEVCTPWSKGHKQGVNLRYSFLLGLQLSMVYFQEQFHVNSRAITFLKQAIKMFILLNNKCLVLPRIKAANCHIWRTCPHYICRSWRTYQFSFQQLISHLSQLFFLPSVVF